MGKDDMLTTWPFGTNLLATFGMVLCLTMAMPTFAQEAGKIPSGRAGLDYVAEIGNGRIHLLGADPAHNRQSYHNRKSFNLALNSSPSAIPGLHTGFSFYHDYLTFPDFGNYTESSSTILVAYLNSTYEFLNEVMLVHHTNIGLPSSNSLGAYSQMSGGFGSYRPYFRYACMNASASDQI